MSAMSRNKGRAFEQRIARRLRAEWPRATVIRSAQAAGPLGSDVEVTDGPSVLRQLWIECQHSNEPSPQEKLHQAERDAHGGRLPVAITHRTGARTSQASMRLSTFLSLIDGLRMASGPGTALVTMELESFIGLLRARTERDQERTA